MEPVPERAFVSIFRSSFAPRSASDASSDFETLSILHERIGEGGGYLVHLLGARHRKEPGGESLGGEAQRGQLGGAVEDGRGLADLGEDRALLARFGGRTSSDVLCPRYR